MMHRLWLWMLIAAMAVPGVAVAQPGPAATAPAPASGLAQGQDKDQPIQIEAKTLEVRDKIKQATFSGDVQVVQGDTTMKCQTLVVFYGADTAGGASAGANAPTPAKPTLLVPQNAQNIRRIEAHGSVTVFTKDQNASGDLGVYDLKSKTVTLTGNVVVSQGQNVIHGERVVVDTVTGNARIESSNAGGAAPSRVRALIQPGNGQNGNVMTLGPSHTN
jgi:lipopolysaccharide export system protein LptA